MGRMKAIFQKESKYKLLFLSIFATCLGYGLFKGVIDNYLAEIVTMGELGRGVTEFFREMPGLLLVFILAVFFMYSAEMLYKAGAVIMVIGMGMLSVVSPGKVLVILSLFLFSLGEHIQLGMKSSMTLSYSLPNHGGQALGYMSSVGQVGTLIGFIVITIAFSFIPNATEGNYKLFFLIATGFMLLSLLLSFGLNGNTSTDKSKSKFYFRKKFSKYYMLEVFYGARKQVFFTFGPYVLILFYKAGTVTISLLFAISAVACFFLAPLVGRIIDRLGYKIVMISDTLILVIVCFFYGFAHHIFPKNVAMIVCCVNYVLDSIISLASMASNVYVQDLSDTQDEMRATISTGISVNHLITIFIALFGGYIWQALGMETLFIISAVLGLCNSAYAATIKMKELPDGTMTARMEK